MGKRVHQAAPDGDARSTQVQRFKRPLYDWTAAVPVEVAVTVVIARVDRVDRQRRRANPCTAAVCRDAWFREKPLRFSRRQADVFGGVPRPVLIAGRDSFRDNQANDRPRVTCDIVYT
jgi:hypothetical protein